MELAYLDHAAATPLRPEVRDAMESHLEGVSGNPSSVHRWGRAARAALDRARLHVARRLDVGVNQVRFVRGGTESVNLAILGRAAWAREAPTAGGSEGGSSERGLGKPGSSEPSRTQLSRTTFLYSAIEHSAVRECMTFLQDQGARVQCVPVSPRGEVSLPTPESMRIDAATLVSVQWVNHETGLVLPVREISDQCREAGVPLHVDAVQAVGRIPIEAGLADFLSLSGHKLGGPRGSGVLVVRDPGAIRPVLFGGGQEGGLRPGTEDVAAAVGLAVALEIALDELASESARLSGLREGLEEALVTSVADMVIHGAEGKRAPHILSLGFPGVPRDLLPGVLDLEGIGCSAGSACRSGSTEVSPVLSGLYGEAAGRVAPLRLSLGWTTTSDEVERAIRAIPVVLERIHGAGVVQ